MSPMGPVPMTATDWPRPIQLSSTPRMTQASGSTIAASRNSRPSSRRSRFFLTTRAGIRANSA